MSKTRDTGNIGNVVRVDTNGNVSFVSGSTTLMSVSSSGAVTTTGVISGSNALSASYSLNSGLLNSTGSVGFATTGSLLTVSSSQQQISSSQQQISASLLTISRSYATTGSNTFTGPQYISNTSNAIGFTSTASLYSDGGLRVQGNSFVSGTAYFNNIVVYGTSSIQYITSSQVNVGSNIITVNTDTPSVRFGGLSVFDSGSTGLTGSIFWDSELNRWIYVNASGSGGGATYGGGMFISGPRNSVGIGCEQGTTACMLLVGQGGDHLTSSLVYHDSTKTCFYGTSLIVSSSGNVGIGSTPSNWANGTENSLQIKNASIYEYGNYETGLQVNAFYNTSVAPSGWKYISTGVQCLGQLQLSGGDLNYNVANPGTAGCAITWNTKFNITRGGNVGIGTTTPLSILHVNCCVAGGATTTVARFGIQDPTGYGTTSPAIELTGTNVGLCFTMGKIAGLNDVSSGGSMAFSTGLCAGTVIERMRITNCGRVGIGTTSPSTNFQVCGNISAENIAWIQNTNSGGYGSLRALNDINCAAVFGIGGSAVSSPYTNTGYIYTDPSINFSFSIGSSEKMRILSTGNVCIFCQISAGPVVIVGNQGGTDTTVITGGSGQGSSVRMNYAGGSYNNFLAGNGDNYFNCLLGKLNAAGGVKFGSGATTLNYYESGTWTPQIYWSNGGQYCMGGINGGNYVRIGNAVHLNFHLQWTAQCGGGSFGGTFRIGGIPFTVGSYRSAGTISAISSGIGRSDICITWHALTADPGANFIYWIENDARGGYSHSPNVSANGLAYSNQLTYTLQ